MLLKFTNMRRSRKNHLFKVFSIIGGLSVLFCIVCFGVIANMPLDGREPEWYRKLNDIEMKRNGVIYVLQYLNRPGADDMTLMSVYQHFPVLVDLARQPDDRDILKGIAFHGGLDGLNANLALFTIKDDPESRLNGILQSLTSSSKDSSEHWIAKRFLRLNPDIIKDHEKFMPVLESWSSSTSDPDLKELVFELKQHVY